MKFKHIYCQDCNTLLAKYNTRYFSDINIAELVRIHYHSHIKDGHSLITRTADILLHPSVEPRKFFQSEPSEIDDTIWKKKSAPESLK
jgi:hypothetical protein